MFPRVRPIGEVTEQALFARVKRRLTHDLEYLKTCRELSRWYSDLGRYYAVNERNHIVKTEIDLETLGRELGLLGEAEVVVST